MILPNDITGLQLTSRWWKQPPDWFCIVCKVDENFRRVQAISTDGLSATDAVDKALVLAAAYTFAPVTYTPQFSTAELDLEIDL